MRLNAILLAAALTLSADGRDVVPLSWPTAHGAPPRALDEAALKWLPAFRVALQTLPEATNVRLALSQPSVLGVPPPTAAKLGPLLAERYKAASADSAYAKARSALPYCFEPDRPTRGYASLYVPDKLRSTPDVILFLHGSGGSFLWYQHFLSEVFPDALIIAPAYGTETAFIPLQYATEAIKAAEEYVGRSLPRAELIGLSAGGFGAARLFASAPGAFSGLTVLAAYAPTETTSLFRKGQRLRFLAGGRESFVLDGSWHRARSHLQSRGLDARFAIVPEADHFFMLTHGKETAAYLRAR